MPLGAASRLCRLVGAECNIHAPADFLKLGNLGAGLFQRVIFRFPLCFEGGIFFLPRGDRQGFHALRQMGMEIAARWKYSQRWQQQHTADELKTIAAAVNYLSEHGISNLDELDAALSSVSDKAYSIREGMKTAEERMKKLQKLIEYGKNYTEYKPIHDELKKLQNGWTNKRDKYEEAHRAELTLWNAASRYLHANLPKGTKTLPIAEWEQEYADLKTQRDSDYTKLKDTRTNVSELQKIRKCVDIALRADQPEQTQSRSKRHEQER